MSGTVSTLLVTALEPQMNAAGLDPTVHIFITCPGEVKLMENLFFMHKQSLPPEDECT